MSKCEYFYNDMYLHLVVANTIGIVHIEYNYFRHIMWDVLYIKIENMVHIHLHK